MFKIITATMLAMALTAGSPTTNLAKEVDCGPASSSVQQNVEAMDKFGWTAHKITNKAQLDRAVEHYNSLGEPTVNREDVDIALLAMKDGEPMVILGFFDKHGCMNVPALHIPGILLDQVLGETL